MHVLVNSSTAVSLQRPQYSTHTISIIIQNTEAQDC